MQDRINRSIIRPDHASKARSKKLYFIVIYKRTIGPIDSASPSSNNNNIVLIALYDVMRDIVPHKPFLSPNGLRAL